MTGARTLPPRFDLAAWGDLRPCLRCRNLAHDGRCRAAGEIAATRTLLRDYYYPPIPGQPRRCYGYAPPADDPEQIPGRERWPWLKPDPTYVAVRLRWSPRSPSVKDRECPLHRVAGSRLKR